MSRSTARRPVRRVALAGATLAGLTCLGAAPGHAAPPDGEGPPGAPAASASSAAEVTGTLVFVRDHDVWISRADGGQQRPLTTSGDFEHPWVSPSMSDTGVVVAARDERIVEMRPSGAVIRTLDPPALESSVQAPLDGTPSHVAISPDGSLIAYSFAQYSCPAGASCDTRYATAYTDADQVTDPAVHGQTYYDAPSWIGNHRTVQGGGAFSEVNVHDLGEAPMHWFRDSEISSPARDLTEPTVSPDGRYVATIRGWGQTTSVLWARVVGSITSGRPSLPDPYCETEPKPVADPAYSADSSVLAWELVGQGIMMSPTHMTQCLQPTLVVEDAEQPAFSAAPYSVPAPEATAAPAARGTAAVGRTLTATAGRWTPSSSSYTYSYAWLRDGRPIAGATSSRYRLVRADGGHRVSVRVTASGSNGTGTATSRAKRVAR
jgi:hypothetical protein